MDKIETIKPSIGLGITFHKGPNLRPGTIIKIEKNKFYFIEDNDQTEEIHYATLSLRKNSCVKGRWIENGINGKFATLFEVILRKERI